MLATSELLEGLLHARRRQDPVRLETVDERTEQLAVLAELPESCDGGKHLGQRRRRHPCRLRIRHRVERAMSQPVPRGPFRQAQHLGGDRHPHPGHLLLAALTHQRQPAPELRTDRRILRGHVEIDQVLYGGFGGADIGDQAHADRVARPAPRISPIPEGEAVECRSGSSRAGPFGRRSGRRHAGQQKAPLQEVGPDLLFRWWRGRDLNPRPSGYESFEARPAGAVECPPVALSRVFS